MSEYLINSQTNSPPSFPHAIVPGWLRYARVTLVFVFLVTVKLILERFSLPIEATIFVVEVALIILIPRLLFSLFADLVLNELEIIYYGKRTPYENISKLSAIVSFAMGYGRAPVTTPIFVMQVYSTQSGSPLTIDLKPYRKKDITLLLKTILAKNPQIEIDQQVQGMVAGDFREIDKTFAKRLLMNFVAIVVAPVLVLGLLLLISWIATSAH